LVERVLSYVLSFTNSGVHHLVNQGGGGEGS
jgi:hypothetical protein